MRRFSHLCLCSSVLIVFSKHALAHTESVVRRERAHDAGAGKLSSTAFSKEVRRHEIRPDGTIYSHHADAFQSSLIDAAVPSEPLLSETPVKIMNRKQGSYLAACNECKGVANTMNNSCSGLLGKDIGCGYTASAEKGSEFEIVKVGGDYKSAINNNDLVVLRSRPNTKGDSPVFAYIGVCGAAGKEACTGANSIVRLYKGNATTSPVLDQLTMFTISREAGHDGPILLGEYVQFIKAGRGIQGRGSVLASCGNSTTGAPCGATSNVFTVDMTNFRDQDFKLRTMWQVSATASAEATPPQKTAAAQPKNATKAQTNTAAKTDATKKDPSKTTEAGTDTKPNATKKDTSTTTDANATKKDASKTTEAGTDTKPDATKKDASTTTDANASKKDASNTTEAGKDAKQDAAKKDDGKK